MTLDAIVWKVNEDQYDDREIITVNLVESYGKLMEFARKHLPDKFFLEADQRRSLRNIIAREMLVNTLIHREMTSSFRAKFVIERDKILPLFHRIWDKVIPVWFWLYP